MTWGSQGDGIYLVCRVPCWHRPEEVGSHPGGEPPWAGRRFAEALALESHDVDLKRQRDQQPPSQGAQQ